MKPKMAPSDKPKQPAPPGSEPPQKDVGLSTKHLALIVGGLGLSVVVLAALMFLAAAGQEDAIKKLNKDTEWRDSCGFACSKKFAEPPLLLISLDGFRADYLDRNLTPAIEKLVRCGTSAPYMYPTHPSKTFPNHFTMVSGLYPESHGIVANKMYDEACPKCSGNSTGPGKNATGGRKLFPECGYFNMMDSGTDWWYSGKPIWNAVMDAGKKAATFFWPGSGFLIDGKMPQYQIPYNKDTPYTSRVEQVVKWLLLPEGERPAFISMYVHQPDYDAHSFGPDSPEVDSQLLYVDAMMNYLMAKLNEQGLLGCVNIVLVSDHGMKLIETEDRVQLYEEVPFSNLPHMLPLGDTIVQFYYRGLKTDKYLALPEVQKLLCKKNEKYVVYTMDTMPRRHHYAGHKRVGEVVLEGRSGVFMFLEKKNDSRVANHGYEITEREMRALFAATGPAFKRSHVVKPFQNIELFNFLSDAMNLGQPAPNNGTYGALFDVLVNPPEYPAATHRDFAACEDQNLLTCGDSCHFELPLPDAAVCYPSHGLGLASNALQGLCRTVLCNATVVLDRTLAAPVVVEALLMDRMSNLDHRANCSLKLDSANDTDCSKKPSGKASISLFPDNNYLWFLEQARIPAGPEFVGGIWKEFGKLVLKYQRHYKTLRLFAGPVFDKDNDGLADGARQGPPTHVFIVLLRCSFGSEWDSDYAHCKNPEDSRVLSFVLPLTDKNDNCLGGEEYLFMHTAKVKDVELLTGLEFFTDRERYSDALAIELRTWINENLWSL